MRKPALSLVFVAVLSFGCAQGDVTVPEGPVETTQPTGDASPTSEPRTVPFTDTEFDVDVTLDDFSFDPTTIKAPGGSTATVDLRNVGEAEHTFTIDALDIDEELDAGQERTIEIELGAETRYEFYCRFHADSKGMKGSFGLH